MAYTHISFNSDSQHGRPLRRALNSFEQFLDDAADTLDTMLAMRDGDGSQAAHYARVTSKYGFETDAFSKQLYDDLKSLMDKLTTNASVSNVKADVKALLDKTR